MKKNKVIALVTSSTPFAFFYILAFIVVIATAIFTSGEPLWVKLSWGMLAMLGVFISLTAYVSFIEARQSRRWPATTARLLSASVHESIGSGSGNLYRPVVEYAFSHNGRDYKGTTIDYSGQSGSEAWAKKVISKLESKGHGLKVHVNPDDPETNVLNPGIRLVHLLRFIIGPAMVVFGVLAAFDVIVFW